MNKLMTIKEASSALGITEMFIRCHLTRGYIGETKNGYPIRLTESEIDIFVLPFKFA